MRRLFWFLLLPVLSVVPGVAQGYNPLPNLVIHARYVYVTTYAGGNLTNPNVMADDRQAVVDVQDAIKAWGRYAVVYDKKEADLVLLVRKGHIVESQPGVKIGAGSTVKPSVGAVAPTNMGDRRDMLALYDGATGIDSAPLWREMEEGGLDPPRMSLVGDLRAAVEKAAKIP